MSCTPKTQLTLSTFIQVKQRDKTIRVPIEKVSHFMSEDKYITAYTDMGPLLLATSLRKLQAIYGQNVVLLHRRTLVFRNRIAEVGLPPHNAGGTATLTNGQQIRTSFNGARAYLNSVAG